MKLETIEVEDMEHASEMILNLSYENAMLELLLYKQRKFYKILIGVLCLIFTFMMFYIS